MAVHNNNIRSVAPIHTLGYDFVILAAGTCASRATILTDFIGDHATGEMTADNEGLYTS